MLGAGWTDDVTKAFLSLYAHDSTRASSSWYKFASAILYVYRVRKLLDRSSEEQESARGEPGLVHAGLMTLQECSCPHAHLRYSACASSLCSLVQCCNVNCINAH